MVRHALQTRASGGSPTLRERVVNGTTKIEGDCFVPRNDDLPSGYAFLELEFRFKPTSS